MSMGIKQTKGLKPGRVLDMKDKGVNLYLYMEMVDGDPMDWRNPPAGIHHIFIPPSIPSGWDYVEQSGECLCGHPYPNELIFSTLMRTPDRVLREMRRRGLRIGIFCGGQRRDAWCMGCRRILRDRKQMAMLALQYRLDASMGC